MTNCRDFALAGADLEGTSKYRLASDEHCPLARTPAPLSMAGRALRRVLNRVMLYLEATLVTPRGLAWFVASYARVREPR